MLSGQFLWDTQERWSSGSGACGSGAQEMKFVSRLTVETAIWGKLGHQACCCRTIIPAFGRQEDLEFKARVGYTASSKLGSARLHETLPQNTKQTNKKTKPQTKQNKPLHGQTERPAGL